MISGPCWEPFAVFRARAMAAATMPFRFRLVRLDEDADGFPGRETLERVWDGILVVSGLNLDH